MRNFGKEWDVVDLTETWLEVRDWEGMKRRLPREFSWCVQGPRKERRRRRAAGNYNGD